jgi:prepilin-type N-terminal cleavage/methylation domain-containing protein/prepilin-type processing-associated H-X9-DG protein
MSPTTSFRRAFTLIEMLLVVSIIALLVALLLPSLSKAKQHAQVAICMTRLNQIGSAALTYAASNQNRFASAFQWTRHVTCWHDWHQKERVTDGLLFPYIRNYDMYLCPTFMSVYKNGDQPYYCGDTGPGIIPYYSYGMNSCMGWDGWAGFAWKTPHAIRDPSKMLFYSEENTWVIPGVSSVSINNGSLGVGPDAVASYHLPERGNLDTGRGNVLFLDLHIELRYGIDTASMCVQ